MAENTGAQQQEGRGSSVKPARKPIKRKQLVSVRRGAAELAEDQATESGLLQRRAAVRQLSGDEVASAPAGPEARMESRFAHDFSQVRTHTVAPETGSAVQPGIELSEVRVHTDSQRALQIGAQAYAEGGDIHFAPGQFRPNTAAGQQLIGHELAHVVQQQQGRVAPTTQVEGLAVNDDPGLERQADSWGRELGRIPWALWEAGPEGRKAGQSAGQSIQRWGGVIQRTGPTLSAVSFTTSGGGPIKAKPYPGGKFFIIESTPFTASGTVRVKGGTDEEAGDWEVGFGQTMRGQSRFTALYAGSKRVGSKGFTISTPKRDALKGSREPWYDSQKKNAPGLAWFEKTNSTASTSLWDQPEIPVPKETPDGEGKLMRTEGKTSFTTFLIARKFSAPNTIKFLNWAAWEVDYGATFQEGADGKRVLNRATGATSGKGTGSGQGSATPILRGDLANTAVKAAYKWL
jgi:hypothetical protein